MPPVEEFFDLPKKIEDKVLCGNGCIAVTPCAGMGETIISISSEYVRTSKSGKVTCLFLENEILRELAAAVLEDKRH